MFVPPWIKFNFQTVFITVSILLCHFSSTFAQQFRFDHWTVDEGLPQNSVYSITQTPDGYLWMTTFDGLVRFDGVRFTIFNKVNLKNLPSNRFYQIFAEDDGSLWGSTEEDGIIRFKDGQLQVFNSVDGFPIKRPAIIQKDLDGSLLFTLPEAILRWRDGKLSLEKKGDAAQFKIYVSPQGFRWEFDKNGLRKIGRDGSQTNLSLPFDLTKMDYSLLSPTIFEDKTNALWIAKLGSLYRIKDGKTSIWGKDEGMPQSQVNKIAQDADGNLWVSTIGDGACQLKNNRFSCYNQSNGFLSENYAMDIFTDREGTIWITTNGKGFNRLNKQAVNPLSTKNGYFENGAYPIFQDSSDNIWIGSFDGLFQFKDGEINNLTQKTKLIHTIVQAFAEDKEGRIWIGGKDGVQYLQNGKVTDFTAKLGFEPGKVSFWDIRQTPDNAIWFAANQGLIKLQNNTVTRFTTGNGLPTNDVKIVFERNDGALAIGTTNGLVLADYKTNENSISILQTYDETNGLAGNHIRSIYEDSDRTLWIGTYDSGLSRLKDGKITNYNTFNGMFSNGVFAILEDNRQNFWMSSNQGIYRVSKQELNDFADGKISKITSTAYGKSDGMLNAECNGGRQPSALKNKDGKLWFPTQDGVAIIDSEAVPFNPNPPPVVIESAVLSGNNVDVKNKLEIQPNQNTLEIRYTGLSFIKPEQTRFRYKLEGLDENWTEAGTRREAFYPYLPPGTYTFRVIAANSDNVWNEQGATLEITVYPAFYRTWWFLILSVLAFIAIIYFLNKQRIDRLKRERATQQNFAWQMIASQEAERKRIAAELHDSLGQRLVVIKNLALLYLTTKDKRQESQIEGISNEASQALNEVKGISYNLRPYQLDRIGLTKAIEAIIRSAQTASEIDFSAEIDDIDNYFPKESEINFYRIVQESVNNILKHSNATKAKVEIKSEEQKLKLIIEDNGVGFSSETKSNGFGLIGIKERVDLLNGNMEIITTPNQGVIIKILIQK